MAGNFYLPRLCRSWFRLRRRRRPSMRRWPEFRQPLFVVAVGLYGSYQVGRHVWPGVLPPLITGQLADLTAMPVFLSLALVAQRRLGSYPLTWVFPSSWLVAAWAYVALVFEVLLPHLSTQAVGDWRDVAAYGLGTWAFRRWLNRPLSNDCQ